MTDYKLANSLAAEALKSWGCGQLEVAADRYATAIAVVATVPDWHSQYAGVLQQLGRHEEATREYEAALALVLEQEACETSPAVKVARYFLAEHLRHRGGPARALDILDPATGALPNDWLIGTARALSLFAAGRVDEAVSAAEHAISNAGSEWKRAELTESLEAVLEASRR